MKNNKSIFDIILILTIIFFVFSGCQNNEGTGNVEEVGEVLSGSVTDLAENDISFAGENAVLRVNNEDVDAYYFNVRVALWEAYGSEDPVNEAINSMKRETVEKEFAEKYGLTPTKEEISEYVKSMKTEIESTEESYAIVNELLAAIGISYNEYWNEYKPKYEALSALTHIKVAEYISENNMPELDISQVEYEILDHQHFEDLNKKYNWFTLEKVSVIRKNDALAQIA